MSLKFEKLVVSEPKHEFVHGSIQRTAVPGGWLVAVFYTMSHCGGPAICFYPDPNHEWDGESLELEDSKHALHV